MQNPSRPEGFERGLILVEETRLNDLAISNSHQEEIATGRDRGDVLPVERLVESMN